MAHPQLQSPPWLDRFAVSAWRDDCPSCLAARPRRSTSTQHFIKAPSGALTMICGCGLAVHGPSALTNLSPLKIWLLEWLLRSLYRRCGAEDDEYARLLNGHECAAASDRKPFVYCYNADVSVFRCQLPSRPGRSWSVGEVSNAQSSGARLANGGSERGQPR